MDKIKADAVYNEVKAALQAIATKHGLTMAPLKGNFTSLDMKVSCVFGDKESVGTEVNPELVRNLKRNGILYNLSMADIDRELDIGKLRGAKFQGLRGKKAVIKAADGKLWLYDAELVGQLMRAKYQ